MSLLFGDIFSQLMLMLILAVFVFMYLCKKVASSNSEVAMALKVAATKRALGLIGKFLK